MTHCLHETLSCTNKTAMFRCAVLHRAVVTEQVLTWHDIISYPVCRRQPTPIPKKCILKCQSAVFHSVKTFFVDAKYTECLKARRFSPSLYGQERLTELCVIGSGERGKTTRQPRGLTPVRQHHLQKVETIALNGCSRKVEIPNIEVQTSRFYSTYSYWAGRAPRIFHWKRGVYIYYFNYLKFDFKTVCTCIRTHVNIATCSMPHLPNVNHKA
jgi:hypothetical protein